MTLAAAIALAVAAVLFAKALRPQPRPQTTEDTWWRVVAMHIEDATPKRRA